MVIAAALSFTQPLNYSAEIRFLVIQKSILGLDPYTAIKSSERVAMNLSEIVFTTSFFNKVMESDYNIDDTYFSQDEQKRRKQWSRALGTNVEGGTGLLTVTVYHADRNQCLEISQAVSSVLASQAKEYVGGDVQIKLVDDPLVSRYPVKPNIPMNAFFGFVLGLVLGFIYVVWRHRPTQTYGS